MSEIRFIEKINDIKIIDLLFWLLPLSVLLEPVSILFSRIVLVLLLINWLCKSNCRSKISGGALIITIGIIWWLLNYTYSHEFLKNDFEKLVVIPILGLSFSILNNKLEVIKNSFTYSTSLYIVFTIIGKFSLIYSEGLSLFFLTPSWWNQISYKSLVSVFNGHPTYVSLFVITSLLILGLKFIEGNAQKHLKLNLLISILHFVFLIALGVKMAILALIAVILYFLVMDVFAYGGKYLKVWVGVLLLSAITIWSIPSVKSRLIKSFNEISQNNALGNVNQRIVLWEAGILLLLDHPFGVGEFYDRTEQALYVKVNDQSVLSEPSMNSHNNILELGIKYGWLGILGYFVLFVLLVVYGVKTDSFYGGAAIIFLLFSLTEVTLAREQGVFWIGIIIASFSFNWLKRAKWN